jgi:signal transduction protein with GAF and PtsI domain
MAYNLPATRLLMNRLRQMMAEDGEARSRLDNVVRLIASTMVADVCSIYCAIAAARAYPHRDRRPEAGSGRQHPPVGQ